MLAELKITESGMNSLILEIDKVHGDGSQRKWILIQSGLFVNLIFQDH